MANDWQIISAEIGPAPSWEGEGGGKMLRIEGVDEAQGEGEGEGGFVGLEGMLDVYGKRLEELRRVVEAGADQGKLEGEIPQSQLGKGEQ